MKLYTNDLIIIQKFWEQESQFPQLTDDQESKLRIKIKELSQLSPYNTFLILFPLLLLSFILISTCILIVKLKLSFWVSTLLLGLIQGYVSYSWSVYTLHECAGHGNAIPKYLKFILFHSCRIFGPDPVQYAKNHFKHHAYLATKQDGAFTQFVSPRRWLKSLLPFSGILYANDYKIHERDEKSTSKLISKILTFSFLIIEFLLLRNYLNSGMILIAILVISPWFAFVLERMRESTEHQFMPIDNKWGARELGLSFSGMLFGGGPWGQPFHLSHHLAPNLPWYAQLKLSQELKNIMNFEQRKFYYVSESSFMNCLKNIFRNYKKLNEGLFYGNSGKGTFLDP